MAPGAHLPKDSPAGEDIQSIIREMLHDELSLSVEPGDYGKLVITLMLSGEPIGNAFTLRTGER